MLIDTSTGGVRRFDAATGAELPTRPTDQPQPSANTLLALVGPTKLTRVSDKQLTVTLDGSRGTEFNTIAKIEAATLTPDGAHVVATSRWQHLGLGCSERR